jgi:hypothetical protein
MRSQSIKFFFAVILLTLLGSLIAISRSVSAGLFTTGEQAPVMVTRTWDGGGATNNWSDPGNWSGDSIPTSADAVVFDGTSSKNAVVDSNFSVSSIQIEASYTGAISNPTSDLSVLGTYIQSGGTFIGGAGSMNLSSVFFLLGGSFTAPSATMSISGEIIIAAIATFNANAGTVEVTGTGPFQNVRVPAGLAINNFVINCGSSTVLTFMNGFTLTVNGMLSLTNGTVARNSFDAVEARGEVLISPTFGGVLPGNPPLFLNITGPAARTVTFPVGAKMPTVTVNAPNVTLNASGSGTFTFSYPVTIQDAVSFTNGEVNFAFGDLTTAVGFNQGSGNLSFDGSFTQTGGTFTLGAGSLTFNRAFFLNGGTFNAPSTPLSFKDLVVVRPGAVFNHNNGTIIFSGIVNQTLTIPSAFTLYNVTVDKADNTSLLLSNVGTLTIAGTLYLTDGGVDLNGSGTKLDAHGDVFMSSSFDGAPLFQPITLQVSGPATRTVAFPVGAKMLPLVVNAPNVTINNSGTGAFDYSSVDLQSVASFSNGDNDVTVNGSFTVNSATVSQGAGDLFFAGPYLQTGGLFNPGAGALSFGSIFTLNAGTFNAPASTISWPSQVRVLAGATFNANGGTVQFNGTGAFQHLMIPTTFTLHNVIVNRQNNTDVAFFNSPSTLVVTGTLQLLDGRLQLNSVANVDAQGDVIVGPQFDGGQMSNIRFTGGANQTFTNNGGVNPYATFWRINKPAGSVVTAATSLALTSGQQFLIESGTLYLAENSNLTTSALLGLGSAGKLVSDSSTTITLGGDITNLGLIDLNGSGAACPGDDTILIRSTTTARRRWEGRLRLIDVDVQNMSSTGTVTAYSSTDSGNNTGWIIDPACTPAVTISPAVSGVPMGENLNFAAGGGYQPYTFAFATNNSGATLSAIGRYTAGNVVGATDVIRVTDSFGDTADATVRVTGPPTKLGFIVQPSNTAVGQPIAPPVKVACQDANGNTVTTINPPITMEIGNNPAGGTLSGTLTVSASRGIAEFSNLSINAGGNGYTLRATHIALAAATSDTFDVTVGDATNLGFMVEPSLTQVGTPIAPPVKVAIRDAAGNTVPTASGPVTISLGNNPGQATLSGVLTANAVNGVATFSSLSVDVPADGYTLVASAGNLTQGTSAPFNVVSAFVVSNTNPDGPGSLAQAIRNSNSTPERQTITFRIPGLGPFRITRTTDLPDVTDRVTIDAVSQPTYSGAPVIELRGSNNTTNGLNLVASSSTVQGLSINGFVNGIRIAGSSNAIMQCYLGPGISPNSVGNSVGLLFEPSASSNFIGFGSTVGSLTLGNVISGNSTAGIRDLGFANIISSNYIGTSPDGSTAMPNGRAGVESRGFGGTTVSHNVISGNGWSGIHVGRDTNFLGGQIYSNYIGVASNGTSALGNGRYGVYVWGSSSNVWIHSNRIASNGRDGTRLAVQENDAPLRPRVPNDPLDPDQGPNGFQNSPVITLATRVPDGSLHVAGSLNSTPNSAHNIGFYGRTTCDPVGNREGGIPLGYGAVTTDAGGIADFSSQPFIIFNPPPGIAYISVTAFDSNGRTSEFSNCQIISPRSFVTGSVRAPDGQRLPNVRVRLTSSLAGFSQTTVTSSLGQYFFNLLPPGNYVVTPLDRNLVFSPASRSYSDLTTNQSFQDFVASAQGFSVAGRVRTSSSGSTIASAGKAPPLPAGGFPLLGVTFDITGPGINRSITNDSFGNYRFDSLPPGSYTVTPSKPNYTFSPPSANITIGGSDQAVDFVGESPGLSQLSGRFVYDSLGKIEAMNADGSGVVTLVESSPRTFSNSAPRISGNGQLFAYAADRVTNGASRIAKVNADGSSVVALLEESSALSSPTFSNNGLKIAFHKGNGDLYTMNADGTNVERILTRCTDPDWSPDDTRIICIENNGSSATVKMINLAQPAVTTIDNSSGMKYSPRWSPDGTKIAFIRRQAGTPATHEVVVSELLGGTNTLLGGTNNLFQTLAWSPDGLRLALTRDAVANNNVARPPSIQKQLVTIQASDGLGMLVIVDDFNGGKIDWGASNSVATPASPAAVTVQSGAVSITFPSTTGANGFTTITPIEPNSAGAAPNGFVFGDFAFELNTTVGFAPPVTICVNLNQTSNNLMPPASPAILHNENGTLVNITTSYDPNTGIICGQANSFSPFVIAEAVNAALPSINGLVIDENGQPISGIGMWLTGAESDFTTTDSNGRFTFVNLQQGGNYNVEPWNIGSLFVAANQDFLSVSGESQVVFTGTRDEFQLEGTITTFEGAPASGVEVNLAGSTVDSVVTNANGQYQFTGLPASGAFSVRPSRPGNSFTPPSAGIGRLTDNQSGIDFVMFAPTAAFVSISGRVYDPAGRPVAKAKVQVVGPDGSVISALTNPFGYYHIPGLEVGHAYLISVEAKGRTFENNPRSIMLVDELTDLDFIEHSP